MKKHIKYILIIIVLLLSIPLIAMQFTSDVQWNIMDVIVAGVLLFGFGMGISALINSVKDKKRLVLYLIAFLLVFILLWIELAVGIFNSPIAGS